MKIRISLIFLILLMTSCTNLSTLTNLESKLENSNDFNDILALKYLRYSYILNKNNDFVSSRYFSKLGVDAYKRKKDFSLVLDDTLKDTDPEMLANFYFLFNCWMYFETNNKNLGEAAICKDSFVKLSNVMEKNKNIDLKDKIISDDDYNNKLKNINEEISFTEFAKNKTIDIFFDYDNYKLNQDALTKISSILKYLNTIKTDYKITVIGHADRVGKTIYNNTIARRRANTVYNVLIKNGVPRDLIAVEGKSSTSPKVITKKQEKNQLNRRVEVIIDTDYRNIDLNPQPFKKVYRK